MVGKGETPVERKRKGPPERRRFPSLTAGDFPFLLVFVHSFTCLVLPRVYRRLTSTQPKSTDNGWASKRRPRPTILDSYETNNVTAEFWFDHTSNSKKKKRIKADARSPINVQNSGIAPRQSIGFGGCHSMHYYIIANKRKFRHRKQKRKKAFNSSSI